MTIGEWCHRVHTLAVEKGWWGNKEIPLSAKEKTALHMLMVTEIAEATESVRNDEPPIWQADIVEHGKRVVPGEKGFMETSKPEGELIELADAVIRIMDYCGYYGWDLEQAIAIKHRYNVSCAYKHGGKAL